LKINNDPRENTREIVLSGICLVLLWYLGSIPGGGQYVGALMAWFAALIISLLMAKWVFRIDRVLKYLQEIRDIGAESNRLNDINLQQNEAIESLLMEIKHKP
jgi:hypothetical protein